MVVISSAWCISSLILQKLHNQHLKIQWLKIIVIYSSGLVGQQRATDPGWDISAHVSLMLFLRTTGWFSLVLTVVMAEVMRTRPKA